MNRIAREAARLERALERVFDRVTAFRFRADSRQAAYAFSVPDDYPYRDARLDELLDALRPLFAEYEEADMMRRVGKGDKAALLSRFIDAKQAINVAREAGTPSCLTCRHPAHEGWCPARPHGDPCSCRVNPGIKSEWVKRALRNELPPKIF